ncbi:MAG: hypothetical protein KF680_04430 [Cryobacterium sp.]|nr:hypothetical protein [Cryobacterium sp.]
MAVSVEVEDQAKLLRALANSIVDDANHELDFATDVSGILADTRDALLNLVDPYRALSHIPGVQAWDSATSVDLEVNISSLVDEARDD